MCLFRITLVFELILHETNIYLCEKAFVDTNGANNV